MLAQTDEFQILIPVFRMLGSDPMYQYDAGIGTNHQESSLLNLYIKVEEVIKNGLNISWKSIVDEPCLAFNYAQAGQENSFTWAGMGKGLELQFPIFDSLSKAGKIRVKTLEESGRWFREQFPKTPATAITTLVDVRKEGNKSVWYNSRFYRSNLYWEKRWFLLQGYSLI